MQGIQPQIKAIQKKYKDKKDQESRQAMSKETMALYQEHGVNPFGSCLPILIQSPFFFGLYRTLSSIKGISEGQESIGKINQNVALQIEGSSFFGIRLSDTFQTVEMNGGQIVIGVLIAFMCVSMFINQRMIMQKNMPTASKEGPQYQTQKMMMYIFPFMYIFSGAIFPVGVLLYWVTTQLWTLGQGIWQIHFVPTPGSEAAEAKEKREEAKQKAQKEKLKSENPEQYEQEYGVPDERKQQRSQPKKKKK
jgi:YidC/Oxa1 family membrane protein insertase